jgi:hypothetical protein
VHVFEDKQDGSLPSRTLKDGADRIRHVEPNRFVWHGRAIDGISLPQLGQDETEVPGSRRNEILYVSRLILGERAEGLGPWPVRRRPFEIARSTPEDARASCVRSGREYLRKRRLADSCLTGSQHDLSASAKRPVERTAQL